MLRQSKEGTAHYHREEDHYNVISEQPTANRRRSYLLRSAPLDSVSTRRPVAELNESFDASALLKFRRSDPLPAPPSINRRPGEGCVARSSIGSRAEGGAKTKNMNDDFINYVKAVRSVAGRAHN